MNQTHEEFLMERSRRDNEIYFINNAIMRKKWIQEKEERMEKNAIQVYWFNPWNFFPIQGSTFLFSWTNLFSHQLPSHQEDNLKREREMNQKRNIREGEREWREKISEREREKVYQNQHLLNQGSEY